MVDHEWRSKPWEFLRVVLISSDSFTIFPIRLIYLPGWRTQLIQDLCVGLSPDRGLYIVAMQTRY